ncbi:hypothetical protein M9978_20015 [Sphingomonas sp. MG17]|uniref:DUF6894 domain-containing protein n=1 Tax=Sphingomonas tagetis TaxID=2949092 RepID=A0A9X2HSJ7_9SPHN|nr:hypothetical protein [Sphingomonas tagetis]MCP3732708.1 hypothetical protein [Sphingomonas tagetis]
MAQFPQFQMPRNKLHNLHQDAERQGLWDILRSMGRFFFHVINDIGVPDEEGEDFDNLAAAHLRAIDYARDLASASVRQGRLDLQHRIEINDAEGKVLATVTFADAVDVTS